MLSNYHQTPCVLLPLCYPLVDRYQSSTPVDLSLAFSNRFTATTMNPYPNDPYNHPNNPYRNPPNPYNNNPAQNFRPNYPVAPFPAQQQLAQQHQRELAPMPANTYGRLQQSLTRIDDREQQYGQRDEERRRFREDTAEARRGAGPNHPAALRRESSLLHPFPFDCFFWGRRTSGAAEVTNRCPPS